ncbi:MAG: hypothetical protein HOV81_18040 [Kofleriaceae bacterium]|nr:hypothetical protein [Kofleriaceae bacterium]
MMRAIAAALLLTIGCSSSGGDDGDKPPVLEITSPARGTLADGETVSVTGRVTDESFASVRVTVGGVEVPTAVDGTFQTTVPVMNGIAIIETHAIDDHGHDVRDVRAVLAGSLAPTDGTSVGKVGARAGVAALRAIGNAIGAQAKMINFTQAAQALNPVYNNTGCLGATINITSINLSDLAVALAPKPNILSTDVTISNLDVRLAANFKVACIGGSTTITLKATKAKVHGDLGASIAAGKIATSLPAATVTFENFSIDVGGVPGAIESLLKDQARDGVARALESAIKSKVPPIANNALAGLVAKPLSTSILGADTSISVTPTKVSLSSDELFVGLDTKVRITGGEGGTALTTPTTVTPDAMGQTQGLGVALDDDIANQLLAGLWSADAFDMSIAIDTIPALGALLDDDARTIDVKLALPPTVSTASGELELAIGDAMLTIRDEFGTEVQSIALSLRTTLEAEPSQSGKILLTVGTPTVYAQVVAESAAVDEPLEDSQVEAIVTGAWGLVSVKADDALSNLPLPTIAGVQLGAPTVEAGDGFVLADIPLQ